MRLSARFHAALNAIFLFVYKSQILVPIVHLETRGATYTRIAWKRLWGLVQPHAHERIHATHVHMYVHVRENVIAEKATQKVQQTC